MSQRSGFPGAEASIVGTVERWPGVSTAEGSRGELLIRMGLREIGHLHGDHALHMGFPKAVWHELKEAGRIDYHPVFSGKPGYAARKIATADDVDDAIALLRINYDRAVETHGLPSPARGGGPGSLLKRWPGQATSGVLGVSPPS